MHTHRRSTARSGSARWGRGRQFVPLTLARPHSELEVWSPQHPWSPFSTVPTRLRDPILSVCPPDAGVAHDTCGGRHGRSGTSGRPGSQRNKQDLISIYVSPESWSAMSASRVAHPKAESRGPRPASVSSVVRPFHVHLAPSLCLAPWQTRGTQPRCCSNLSKATGLASGRARIRFSVLPGPAWS